MPGRRKPRSTASIATVETRCFGGCASLIRFTGTATGVVGARKCRQFKDVYRNSLSEAVLYPGSQPH